MVHLVATRSALVDGDIRADGDGTSNPSRGGASGGSIWIEAGHLTGMFVYVVNGSSHVNGSINKKLIICSVDSTVFSEWQSSVSPKLLLVLHDDE